MNRNLTDEDRVRWLNRRELGVIYWRCCEDKTIGETGIVMNLKANTVQFYTTEAYKKLGLEHVAKEDKAIYAKRDFCKIIRQFITDPKMIDEWIAFDPYTHAEIITVEPEPVEPPEEEKGEEPEEDSPIIIIDPSKKTPLLRTPRSSRLTCLMMLVYALILILVGSLGTYIGMTYFPRLITESIRETSIVTEEVLSTVMSTVIHTEIVYVEITLTPEPTPVFTPIPSNTPEPSRTPTPTPVLLISDNFNGKVSDNWEVIQGAYLISNDGLTTAEEVWMSVGDTSWINYEIELTVVKGRTIVSNMERLADSICVRVQDTRNMICYRWANNKADWVIIENGKTTEVPESEYRPSNKDPYKIKIIVEGNSFRVVNGTSFSTPLFPTGGVVIILYDPRMIDDLLIKELP